MLHEYRQLQSLEKKTEEIYSDMPKDDEKRFDTSSEELDRPLPEHKNKKKLGSRLKTNFKNVELDGKIMAAFALLLP